MLVIILLLSLLLLQYYCCTVLAYKTCNAIYMCTCRPRSVATTPCSAGSTARFPTSAFSSGMNLAYRPLFVGSMACWASNACLASPLAKVMAVDGTVFESGPRGSGGVVSVLLLEVAIALESFCHYIVYMTSYSSN